MPFDQIEQIKIHCHESLREVMRQFSVTSLYTQGSGFGVVVNESGVCVGVVTDGDIRRQLVEGISIDAPVDQAMNCHFIYARVGYTAHQILRLFDKKIRQIPVLDDAGRLVDLLQFTGFNASARGRKRMIRARAPGRMSFSGGGTDMTDYFHNATGYVLNVTINKYCYASVRVRDDAKIILRSHDYRHCVEAPSLLEMKFGDSLDLIRACVKIMEPSFGFELETYSEMEPGTGLGGSSAMCAAVIGALNHFRNENHLDNYALADLSYQAERVEMGVLGGWQDQYASVFGGFNLMEFRNNDIVVFPLRVSEDILLELHCNLLLFRFGATRDSGSILHEQIATLKGNDAVHRRYEQLSQLTFKMKDALLTGGLTGFGTMLHEGWELKKSFSSRISNLHVNELYDAARAAGALGGKVLGAGSDGYLLLYCASGNQRQVIDELARRGARREFFDFVHHGLQTWTSTT